MDLVINKEEAKEEIKTIVPKIVMGHVDCSFPKFRELAWDIIRPQVEMLAEKSLGEYGAYHVHEAIKYGKADLFMGYIDKSGKSTLETWQDYFVEFIQKGTENYFGYVITRYDQDSVHIWQAYVKDEYQHTNAMVEGFGFIENAMKKYSVKYLTFSSPRAGWGKMCEKLGFTELYTIYRKKIER
jgi:hypothetical protein